MQRILQEIIKKKKNNPWNIRRSTSHFFHQTSKPAYYIIDCRIFTVHKVIWSCIWPWNPEFENGTVWLKRVVWPLCTNVWLSTLYIGRFLTFTAINGEEVELRLTTHYVSINILPFCFNIYILLLYVYYYVSFKCFYLKSIHN